MSTNTSSGPSETSPSSQALQASVVGIGASAGGIAALKTLLSLLPSDSGMAFIVVLHLSPEHESHLAAILQSETKMPVTQVTGDVAIEPNNVYVNPPTQHVAVHDRMISLVEPGPSRGRRIPIDLLFRTMAESLREEAICVILSGTGSDGTQGLGYVKEAGGIAIAQDPDEAEYDAMVRSAIASGSVDFILHLADIPARLLALQQRSTVVVRVEDDEGGESPNESDAETLRKILGLVKVRTGHDFSGYKMATLARRIARRLSVRDHDSLQAYLGFVRENPEELEMLLRDFLISVTSFFRDPGVFDELQRQVIPRLFDGKGADDIVRVWSAGCATGEEAYSVAILLNEYAAGLAAPPRIQIFASDIDATAIATAREGRYGEIIAEDVTPQRLAQYFVNDGDGYTVKKVLRDVVLFARHNILRDPPFSQLDLVTCRNLLIYLNNDAQAHVLRTIHFALRPGGFLLLGSSESADSMGALYSVVDRRHHLYRARVHEHGARPMQPIASTRDRSVPAKPVADRLRAASLSFGEIHHRLVERYCSPSLLVNDDFEVLHLSELVGKFLRFGGGEVSSNVLSLVHPEVRPRLRDALLEAKQSGRDTVERGVPLGDALPARSVSITVRPFAPDTSGSRYYLIIFDETVSDASESDAPVEETPEERSSTGRLERELKEAKEQLRLRGEQSEISDQELRSNNEELLSIIEELRSASEELETSKEELQSVNEELSTVNNELKDKIEEVSVINADLQNLLSVTSIATIFLDGNQRIRRYTPLATGLFNLIETDVGRPLRDLTNMLEYDRLDDDVAEVLRSQIPIEREVRTGDKRVFIMRALPYDTLDGSMEGVVLTFVDITDRKSADESRRWLSEIVSSSNDAIVSFALDGTILSWNGSAERMFGYSEAEILGQSISVLSSPRRQSELTGVLDQIRRGERVTNYETTVLNKDRETVNVSMSVSPITDASDAVLGVTAIIQDISERRGVQEELAEVSRRKDEFLAMLAHELRNPLAPILSGLELIREADGDHETTQVAVGIIERQMMQMIRLVDDLLDVSRITTGAIRLQKKRIDVRDVIAMALETSGGLFESARITCESSIPSDPIYLEADAARLTQVVVNLLTNAAKYTNAEGHIWLTVSVDSGMVEIAVRDTGIGIDPAMLTKVFEIFTQMDRGQQHSRGGLGVGLSVVKTLVQMHGGTVEAHSKGEGKGSEFVVRLPLATTESGPTESPLDATSTSAKQPPLDATVTSTKESPFAESMPATPSGGNAGPASESEPGPEGASAVATRNPTRVLVVDDNVDAARMLGSLLVRDGHDVRFAVDGTSAVAQAKEFAPEVCLLDIGLPDIDGYEVARRIRADGSSAVLIALTGWGQDEDRVRSHEAGIDHHVVKPVQYAMLRQLMSTDSAPAAS